MGNQVELQKQNIKVWVIIQTCLGSDCLIYPPNLFNNLLHFNDFILETNVWIIHKPIIDILQLLLFYQYYNYCKNNN